MPARHLKFVLLLVGGALSTGCVSQEGIGVGTQPYVSVGMVKYSRLPNAEPEEGDERVANVTLIGTLSAYRGFDADDYEREYEKYAKGFEKWESGTEPNLSFEGFSETMAGWTNVKVFGIPLIAAAYMKALVPRDVIGEVDFESGFGTFLLQSSSDLVAAVSNDDGAFVVKELLCPDTQGFTECKKQYHRGIFEAATGKELRSKLRIKEDGVHIDPATFKIIESEK